MCKSCFDCTLAALAVLRRLHLRVRDYIADSAKAVTSELFTE